MGSRSCSPRDGTVSATTAAKNGIGSLGHRRLNSHTGSMEVAGPLGPLRLCPGVFGMYMEGEFKIPLRLQHLKDRFAGGLA